jgi:tRNA pseudouridine55 synthase
MHGALIVDKPEGPTSHDVVSWARRALGTRAVGHAGTLDPMASGILVLGVGEGTKLLQWMTSEDKEYETTIALGVETDTLDAQGRLMVEEAVPELSPSRVEHAALAFVGTYLQRAPAVSAIKQGGVALHERVRRGEQVIAPEREVVCRAIEVLAVRERAIDLRVRCGKGFYVRSLGRDLALALGTRGHLSALRRTRSGAFDVASALDGERLRSARSDEAQRAAVRAAVLTLPAAVDALAETGMVILRLDAAQSRDVAHGKRIAAPCAAIEHPIALLDPSGALIAIAAWESGALRVLRGFRVDVAAAGSAEGREEAEA